MTTEPRPPLCGSCGQGIRSCAPCCRHTGWVHRDTGDHGCASGSGQAVPAIASQRVIADATPAPEGPDTTIPCEGGCGRRLRSRYVRDWCGDCFRNLPHWPVRPPLRETSAERNAR